MPGEPTEGCCVSQGSMRQGAGSTGSHTRMPGMHMSHTCTRMHTGQYLSRPFWETQPSWRATLPSPREQAAVGEENQRRENR